MTRIKASIIVALLALAASAAHAAKIKWPGERIYAYRYQLTDKHGTAYSLDKAQKFLTRKSLERRERQGLRLDSTDLPVSRQYLRQFEVKGVQVVGTSRWQNTVLALSADSSALVRLAALPCVAEARCVFVSPDSIDKQEDIRWTVHEDFNKWDSVVNDPLGMARPQLEMLGGDRLHEAGYRGQGMTVAILDGGFQNYDRIPAFRRTRILGLRDVVPATIGSPGKQAAEKAPLKIDHGTKVLSAMAAQAPEVTMGSAPEAAYWLLRCEEPGFEQPIEEDFWAMAAELADSLGADVINSSLGYYAFDGDRGSYRLQNLDGRTALISREASMLARKGIVLCNSAGNSGMGQWKKIGVPADAPDILTVGAITPDRKLATFSSLGPSQDGRVKPDVVAQGAPAVLISGRGTLVRDMGTSFSTPIVCGLVACLWQALPGKTALEIIDLVRRSADQYDDPTNIFGYGVPNLWQACKKSDNE
ncbi:MAG: S8 family serine peptidase [Prevotella sp.]|nr:S8 family serine peptidase [Prevotella sp.]